MKFDKALVLAVVLIAGIGTAHAQQQPPSPPTAAQDGFVPVDAPLNPQDAIPAPRLVGLAYGFIWLVFFGYLVSLRTRLSRVEREIETVNRRVTSGGHA